jgi:hypothetical protein
MSRGRDQLIDGYRGVAVLLVVTGHALGFHFSTPQHVARVADALASIGVQLFFVISGYIISAFCCGKRSEPEASAFPHSMSGGHSESCHRCGAITLPCSSYDRPGGSTFLHCLLRARLPSPATPVWQTAIGS